MKKILLMFVAVVTLFQSCKKDEVDGTATRPAAGEWFVTADAIKEDGSLVAKDVYGLGHFIIASYNTSENSSSKMFLDDSGNFWDFKGVVNLDINNLTFSADNIANNSGDPITFDVTNGKILKGAATTPSGVAADSIVFEIKFSDDDDPSETGFDKYRITGYRYTGLVNDED